MRARKSTVRTTPSVKKPETEVLLPTTTSIAVESATSGPLSTATTNTTTSAVAAAALESNSTEKTSHTKPSTKTESVAGPSAEIDTPTFVPEEDGYRCPVEDCRKLFRRDNLLGVILIIHRALGSILDFWFQFRCTSNIIIQHC